MVGGPAGRIAGKLAVLNKIYNSNNMCE